MTKKKVNRNFYPENGNFSSNWAAKNFFGPPQIRRQVSAHGPRPTISSRLSLFRRPNLLVTSLLCSRPQLSPLLFVASLNLQVSIVSLGLSAVCCVIALFSASIV